MIYIYIYLFIYLFVYIVVCLHTNIFSECIHMFNLKDQLIC